VITQSDPTNFIDEELQESLCRAYGTALTVLANAARAENLVLQAVNSIDPAHITSKSIREVVVQRLVQAQVEKQGDPTK
jgi:hypothetical protein